MPELESSTESGVLGSIALVGNSLHVRFRYNTDIFKALTKLRTVTYDKDKKVWIAPLRSAHQIFSSKLFNKNRFRYDFDEAVLKAHLEELKNTVLSARERALSNPFSVTAADIELIEFDVIAQAADIAGWIELKPSNTARRAKKSIAEFPGVFAVGRKKKFYTNAAVFAELLKIFREKQFSFAVAESLSTQLKASATLRQSILKCGYAATAQALEQSFLLPGFDATTREETLQGFGFFTEARAEVLPQKKGQRLTAVTAAEVVTALYRGLITQCPVFITKAGYAAIQPTLQQLERMVVANAENFPDEALYATTQEVCWRTDGEGKGGLHCSSDYYTKIHSYELDQIIAEFEVKSTRHNTFGFFLAASAGKLPGFFDAVKSYLEQYAQSNSESGLQLNIPISRSFRELIGVLSVRANRLVKQKAYQSMVDADLQLQSNAAISDSLYPHQRVAIKWMLENESGMLGDDMGLGKTLSVLVAFLEARHRKETDFLLVICPNSLVRNWVRESEQWIKGLDLRILPDSKKERESFLTAMSENRISSIDGLIINFEAIRIEPVWQAFCNVVQDRPVFLCIDESQRIKNPQSKTFQAMKQFGLAAKKRFLLSGTPTPRDIADLWGQVFIIDKGERFGTSFTAWLKTVAELGTKWSEFAVKRFIPSAVEEVASRAQEILLRRKKEDVISLPEKVFIYRDVEMTGDQKKRFEQVRDELLVQVSSHKGKEKLKAIESILEEYLRAVQVCSNPRLIDETWVGDPAKFKELDDIIADVVTDRGEKIVIWTNYLKNVDELVERYKAFGALPFSGKVDTADRQKHIQAFQDKESANKILIAVPAAGGVGITLTAAQTCVYIDRTWNAEHWLQSIDRVHRIGQKGTVTIIVLNGSKVDELIGFNLHRKKMQMDKLLSGDAAYESFLPTLDQLLEALS